MMDMLAGTFIHPFLLGFMAAVPLLWLLMKLLPPPVRKVYFPAAFLLAGVVPQETTAARMPLWIFLLRAAALTLFILAFAHPVFDRHAALPGTGGSVVLAIDNGWASASRWNDRVAAANDVVSMIAQTRRNVILLPTAPQENGRTDDLSVMSPDAARAALALLKPLPWPVDHVAATDTFRKAGGLGRISHAVYLGDGPSGSGNGVFLSALEKTGGLTVVDADAINHPLIFRRDESKRKTLSFTLQRLNGGYGQTTAVRAYADDGSLVDQREVGFSGSATSLSFDWDMPADISMRATRFKAGDGDMGAALYQRISQSARQAGVLTDGTENPDNSILSDAYYLRRALQEDFTVYFGDVERLVKRDVPVMIWPDSTILNDAQKQALLDWVAKGGRLIRFSGANLAAGAASDALLPVPLRNGERVMKNGLTGQEPLHIGDVNAASPLAGIAVPPDVTVSRQALASPTPEVFEKTWVSLSDGTPLVTAARKEKGDIILVHTTAGSAGSNLCFSGFYVEMLSRMISGYAAETQEIVAGDKIRLQRKMNAFGAMQPAGDRDNAAVIGPDEGFFPSPRTPPGIYGNGQVTRVMNLGEYLPSMTPLADVPVRADRLSAGARHGSDLRVPMLVAALILFLADVLVRLEAVRRGVLGMVVILLCGISVPSMASPTPSDLTAGVYIGHIVTGDAPLDGLARRGLEGLSDVVRARTTIDLRGVVGVDPQKDDLSFYPVLYWPLNYRQAAMPENALRALQNYMRQGGLLMIDTRDGGDAGPNRDTLQRLLSVIAVPALMPVPQDHILGRSFYLLQTYPGAQASGDVWVEKEPDPNNDAVTSIIMGGHDWAAAWSFDDMDRQRFAVSPGGEGQRETAYRFGVNMMMMALAGNYKSDQIHVTETLKRFGQ